MVGLLYLPCHRQGIQGGRRSAPCLFMDAAKAAVSRLHRGPTMFWALLVATPYWQGPYQSTIFLWLCSAGN